MNDQQMAPYRPKRHRARRRSGVGTGTTSLLMIFTVLCFATLAMLSLSTAASNQRIQARGLEGQRLLAQAKGAAATEVANLDETLLQICRQLEEKETVASASAAPIDAATTEDLYFEQAYAAATQRGWEIDEENRLITIRFAIDDGSELATQLHLLEPGGASRYEVVSQVSELVNGWTPEEGGQLWMPS